MKAIVDIARGEAKPTTLPVWEREHFVATSLPPNIKEEQEKLFDELENATCDDIMVTMPAENMVSEYFTISQRDMVALRRDVPFNLTKTVTSFEHYGTWLQDLPDCTLDDNCECAWKMEEASFGILR